MFSNDMTQDSNQHLMHQMNSKTDSNWKNRREVDLLANQSAETSQIKNLNEYAPVNENS